jgi:hypothetical protein
MNNLRTIHRAQFDGRFWHGFVEVHEDNRFLYSLRCPWARFSKEDAENDALFVGQELQQVDQCGA